MFTAISLILFCLADYSVHSIKHYAKLSKKIIGCTLFIVTLALLLVSITLPTIHFEEYSACPAIPAWLFLIETVVIGSCYIYIAIHVVLFIYHFNLRTQLDNMNIEEVVPSGPVDRRCETI